MNVNVTPTSHDATSDTPEIRKYKKRFNSEILCAALWGVNLLIGTENGLMLLDRSGQGKVSKRKKTKDTGHILHCHHSLAGVPADIPSAVPADGGARRPEHTGDHLGQEEPCPRLLPVLAQVKDSAHRRADGCKSSAEIVPCRSADV